MTDSAQRPLVAVIVAAYNEQATVELCLASLSEQTYSPMEIIVVDDGSTDSTVEIARNYATKVFLQPHRGPAVARNLGASRTDARILVFADADMSFDRRFVERLVEPIIAGSAIGTFTKEEYVRNWDRRLARCWNLNNGLTTPRRHPDDFPDRDWVFRAIDRSAFERAGGYADVGYGEDVVLGKKVGEMAVAAPGAVCYHDNPSTWRDVFRSARWYGRGETVDRSWRTMLRHTLPWSVKNSLRRAISCREPLFPLFKVVHDFAVLVGIFEARFLNRGHCK